MWQEVIVIACVAAAAIYLARRYWLKAQPSCGTGACGGCGSARQCQSTKK